MQDTNDLFDLCAAACLSATLHTLPLPCATDVVARIPGGRFAMPCPPPTGFWFSMSSMVAYVGDLRPQ